MLNRDYYDRFIEKTPYLKVMQKEGIFEIAPNITKATGELVTSLFHLNKGEGILLIRKNYDNKYFVITTLGLYHNIRGVVFCLKWDEISSVGGGGDEYWFYRNKRLVFSCVPDYVLFGYAAGSPDRVRFLLLLKTFPSYKYSPSFEAKQFETKFREAMSNLPDYMNPYDSPLESVYNDHQIPDTESILYYRYHFLSGQSFIITDNSIYFDGEDKINSFRMRWDSIYSVGTEARNLCFYDKQGNKITIPINNVVKRKKRLFESEESLLKDVELVKDIFKNILLSVKCKFDKFNATFPNYPERYFLNYEALPKENALYIPRCPYCGSASYELSENYYKEDRKAHAKHDLQDLASSAISVALGGKPSRSSYDSQVTPQYICHDCHQLWKVRWQKGEQ